MDRMEQSDHDLLITINTKVEMLLDSQTEFMSLHRALEGRVTALEAKDRGDSEKTKAISADVQRSLHNHERIGRLEANVESIKESVSDLKKKAGLWDIANAIGVAIAAALAWFWGNKP